MHTYTYKLFKLIAIAHANSVFFFMLINDRKAIFHFEKGFTAHCWYG